MRPLIVFAVLLAASQAFADARIAVVPLDGLGVDAQLLERLNRALKHELDDLAIARVADDEVSAAIHKINKDCAGDAACLADIGAACGATRVLTGTAGMAGDELRLTIKVIDVAAKKEVNTLDAAAPADQSERRVRETAMKLVAPDKYNTSGSVVVETPLAGALVMVDGTQRGKTPLFGAIVGIAPGRREVEVQYAGAKSWRGFVDVAFDAPVELDVDVKDGAVVQLPRETVMAKTPKTSTNAPKSAVSTWTLVGAGVGIVGVVALLGAAASFSVADAAFVQIHDDRQVTKALVDQNRNAALAYGILLPVGLASLVGGGALIAFSVME